MKMYSVIFTDKTWVEFPDHMLTKANLNPDDETLELVLSTGVTHRFSIDDVVSVTITEVPDGTSNN